MQKKAWSSTFVPGILRTLFLIAFATSGISFSVRAQVPVNLFTGTPRIAVPLGGVSDHDLSDAFALTYNTRGVSVKAATGFYGLGWQLSGGGGSVVREVRGLPDDLNEMNGAGSRKGWLNDQSNVKTAAFGDTADQSAATCSDELSDYNQLTALTYVYDTEPDIFHYSVGGVSGSFVFDNSVTPQIRLIPYADIKIEPQFTWLGGITAFTITTNDGVVYQFSDVSTETRQAIKYPGTGYVDFGVTEYMHYKTLTKFNTAWNLRQVTSPSGAKLTYTYELIFYDGKYSGYDPDNTLLVSVRRMGTDEGYSGRYQYRLAVSSIVPRLKKVTTSTGDQLEFSYRSWNTDDPDDKGLLSRVSYRSSDGTTKDIFMEYVLLGCGSFYSNCEMPGSDDNSASYDYSTYKRGFLRYITEKSGCDQLPPYEFFYKDTDLANKTTTLPLPNSMSVDFWGYYNARVNINRRPTLHIYPQLDPAERYRVYPIDGYTGEHYVLSGSDLMVNPAAMQAGTLNVISYPTGGRTILEYEPNEFYDAVAAQSYPGAGLRIKSITQEDGVNANAVNIQNFTYKDANDVSSGRMLYKPSYAVPLVKYINPSDSSFKATHDQLVQQGLNPWLYLTARVDVDFAPDQGTVLYKQVKVSMPGAGYSVSEFTVPGVWGASATDIWSPVAPKIARSSACASAGLFTTAASFTYPYFSNPDIAFEQGLLLNSRDYNEQGLLVREQINTYQYIYRTGTTATNVWGLQYHKFSHNDYGLYYSKYALLTDVTKTLASKVVKVYDVLNTGRVISTTQEFYHESPHHRLPTRTRSVQSDGTVYTTYSKYPLDYGAVPAGADKPSEMIGALQAAFRNGTVIEQYTTMQPISGTTVVQGASLIKLDNFTGTTPLLKQQLQLTSIPLSSFVFSTINPSTKIFEHHANYEVVSTVSAYDAFGLPTTTRAEKERVTSSTGWGITNGVPTVKVTHAASSEYAFSDFDIKTLQSFDMQGGSIPTNVRIPQGPAQYAIARTGNNAVYPTTRLRKILIRGASRYIFSGWVNPQLSNVTLTLKIMNNGATTTYHTKNISAAPGDTYQYFEYVVPIDASLSTFLVEVTGTYSALVNGKTPGIDDIAFYPEHADLTSFTYTLPYGQREQTVRNRTAYTEYDKLGRVSRLLDQDRNIVKRNTYSYAEPLRPVLRAGFSYPAEILVGKPATFTANTDCTEGVLYHFTVDSPPGDVGGWTTPSQTYTFPSIGPKTVYLRVSNSDGFVDVYSVIVDVLSTE
jgi:hypothetical protein